jgi:hypothetical protein
MAAPAAGTDSKWTIVRSRDKKNNPAKGAVVDNNDTKRLIAECKSGIRCMYLIQGRCKFAHPKVSDEVKDLIARRKRVYQLIRAGDYDGEMGHRYNEQLEHLELSIKLGLGIRVDCPDQKKCNVYQPEVWTKYVWDTYGRHDRLFYHNICRKYHAPEATTILEKRASEAREFLYKHLISFGFDVAGPSMCHCG